MANIDSICYFLLMSFILRPVLAMNFTTDEEMEVTEDSTSIVSSVYGHGTTESTDYMYMYFQIPTWEDVEDRMTSSDTLEFLSTFRSGFERDMVYQQLRNCPLSPMCEFRLVDYIHAAATSCCEPCSCDFPKCLQLGTCCLDILLRNTNIAIETDVATSDDSVNMQKPDCLPLHLSENKIVTPVELLQGAFMYNTCPPETNQQLLQNCTRQYTNDLLHYQDIVPFMNTINGDVYRNKYCAYCNKVVDKTLERAWIYLNCKDQRFTGSEYNTIEAAFEGVCDLLFKNHEYFHFSYCTISISECNTTGQWLSFNPEVERACKIYSSPIRIRNKSFENIFCAMCNGVEVERFQCSSGNRELSFSFAGLLKLEASKGSLMNSHEDNNCSDEQLYDHVFKTCRDILCPPLTVLNNGLCLDMYSDLQAVLYAVYLKIVPAKSMSMGKAYTIADNLLNYITDLPMFRHGICGMQLMYHLHRGSENNTTNNIVNETSELDYYKARIHLYRSDLHQLGDMYEKYIILHKTNHNIADFDYETKQLKALTFNFELFDFDSEPFDIIGNLAHQFRSYLYEDSSPLPLQSLIENFTHTRNEHDLEVFHLRTNDYFAVCSYYKALEINILHLKRCPKVKIKQDKAIWDHTDYGIKILNGNFYVNDSDLLYDMNGDVLVCIDAYDKYMSQYVIPMDDMLSPMIIVSIVSSSLSIVTLAFTFVVFLLLPQLRKSLPGKTNMSLVLVLICAHCLYLVSSMGNLEAGSTACIAFGMALHFFWLLALNWMNVCTYHMFHVLTRTKLISNKSGWCRFFVYHLYAIIMSTIPIIVNILVSVATSDSYGYGADTCYIFSQEMVRYTFGIPVLIIIISNLCMYFIVVHKLSRSHSIHKNVQHERNDFLIFIKLSTITGATWIFGFIYKWTGIIVFAYLFIIFNAGQGIFIMFALVINRRVFNMFRSDLLGLNVTSSGAHKRTRSTDDAKERLESYSGVRL